MGLAAEEGIWRRILLKEFDGIPRDQARELDVRLAFGSTKDSWAPSLHGALTGYAGGSAIGLSVTGAYGQSLCW
jgi:hypothetical protein